MDVADLLLFIEATHVRSVAEFSCAPSSPLATLPLKYTWYDIRPKLVAHLRASFNPTLLDVDYRDVRPADLCVVTSELQHWPPETARQFLEALAQTRHFKHVLCCDIV